MKILQTIKEIPGGLMIVPLLLGTIVNTFFGNVLWSVFNGTFTTYLQKSGVMPILVVFIFCNTTTISFEETGVTVYKGMLITAVKVGVGIIVGLICGTLFREGGLLGLSTPIVIGALANSNGRLYTALVREYGDATDVGAVSILSINDDPSSTVIALGATGVAKVPMSILVDCVVPIIMECILGDLDEDIRKFCEPGATMLTPFFAFPLGVGLNIMNLLEAGGPEVLLGVACTLITGLTGYLVYKLLRIDHLEVGGAIGTTADNTAATPALVAAVDATPLAVAEAATAQITTATTVTTILYPVLVSYLHEMEVRKHGG